MYRKLPLLFVLFLPAAMLFAEDSIERAHFNDPGLVADPCFAEPSLLPPVALLERARLADVLQPSDVPQVPDFAYANLVFPLSEKYDVNWRLIAAVMKAESNFNSKARSPKGALGLMQLMPRTAAVYRVKARELLTPHRNLEAGVQHLRKLIERYAGNIELVLAAYNSGEANVDRYQGIPPYRATRNFVKKVLEHYSSFF